MYIFYNIWLNSSQNQNFSDKSCKENQNTHFMIKTPFFFFENRAVYEIRWKNIVKPGRSQMTIWRIRIASWITRATDTHSEYVILIAFPLHQWLHERASVYCPSRLCFHSVKRTVFFTSQTIAGYTEEYSSTHS